MGPRVTGQRTLKMKHATRLALFLAAFTPYAAQAGDFSNPVPFGFSGAGSTSFSSSAVDPATAEQLRLNRMNVGTPNTVIDYYTVTNDLCINCISIGDNATDVAVTADQSADGTCMNVNNTILNAEEGDTLQQCDEAVQ